MIVGVDIGTQSLKAVVTDGDLKVLGEAATDYQPSFPKPGWAEQNPILWESALAPTIARGLDAAGIPADAIKAIGIGGQLDGCIPVNKNGQATYPCIIWMDRRAEAQTAGLSKIEIRGLTGVNLDASHLAAKIRWIKDNLEPDAGNVVYHVPVSYLVQRLTGQHVIDHAHASTSMLYNLNNKRYDPSLLDMFAIEEHKLPTIREAGDVAGVLTDDGARLTGLPVGTPVAVGTGDDFSTPLGAGLCGPGRVVCVLGTAEVVGALHPSPLLDSQGLVETHAYPAGQFFIENPGWLSGGALTWFKDTFRIADFSELDALAEVSPVGSGGVTFLPGLSGTMAPEWVASARGCFYGMTPATGAGDMARAMLEGTAFAMRDVIERLTSMGVEANSITLLGGGAKSEIWARIRADATGLPVEIPAITDTAPIGSAILAAISAGIQPNIPTACALVGKTKTLMEPNHKAKPRYDDAHCAYLNLFSCLAPLF